MKSFKFEVSDGFFPQTFKGEIIAENKAQAADKVKEIYASELDTTKESLKVKLSIIK